MSVRRRAIAISGATLAGAAALISACTPTINTLLNKLLPDAKPVPVLPVAERPSDTIHADANAPPPAEPHTSLAPRDLPY